MTKEKPIFYFSLDVVPDALENLQGLFILTIRDTPIKKMTDKLSTLPLLNVISLINCSLTELPDLSKLPFLTQLLLDNNRLTQVKGINSVVFLFLTKNLFTEVPAIANPQNVRTLAMSDNRLTNIPDLSQFKSLMNVDFRRNSLSAESIQQVRTQVLANQPKAKISA